MRTGRVTVIGGGSVGFNAVLSALGLGAEVTVIDINQQKLEFFYEHFEGRVKTRPSYPEVIEEEMKRSDLLVGAVLVTGIKAPKLITKKMISQMEEGSVFVDVAIDQGGCSETSRPTTHDAPVYKQNGVIHYCVTNMPSPNKKELPILSAVFLRIWSTSAFVRLGLADQISPATPAAFGDENDVPDQNV